MHLQPDGSPGFNPPPPLTGKVAFIRLACQLSALLSPVTHGLDTMLVFFIGSRQVVEDVPYAFECGVNQRAADVKGSGYGANAGPRLVQGVRLEVQRGRIPVGVAHPTVAVLDSKFCQFWGCLFVDIVR